MPSNSAIMQSDFKKLHFVCYGTELYIAKAS